jgi:hypothetical protein
MISCANGAYLNATRMRPSAPGDVVRGGATEGKANPSITDDPALQRAKKGKEVQ